MEPAPDQQPSPLYPYPPLASSVPPGVAYPPDTGSVGQPVRANGLAIGSLILGIVSLFFFGVIAGGLAMVYGGLALNQMRTRAYTPASRGMAIVGLILGTLGAVLSILFLVTTKHS